MNENPGGYSKTFNDRCTFLKAQAITPHLFYFFRKYFLHRQHNRYIGFAIYLSIYLFIYLSIYLSMYIYIYIIYPNEQCLCSQFS